MYEIKRNASIDFRTDLFQIGIVLVEALTGKHPFNGSPDYFHSLNNFDPATLDGFDMTDGIEKNNSSRCWRLTRAGASGRWKWPLTRSTGTD